MAKVGRNEPCPCGSGRKYKQCHLDAHQTEAAASERAMRVHDMDRDLVPWLTHYASGELGDEWFEDVFEEDLVQAREGMASILVPCSVYEWTAGERGTVRDMFMGSQPAELSERERGWLEAQARAWLSVWEVRQVTPGLSVDVRDVFTGEERHVLERAASQSMTTHDNVLARVVDFDGLSVFCGLFPRSLSPRPAAEMVAVLRKKLRLGTAPVSGAELRAKVPMREWLVAWEQAVQAFDAEASRMPMLQNTDGHPMLITRDRFEFEGGDRAGVLAQLAKMSDHEQEDLGSSDLRTFVFQREGHRMNPELENTIVGRAEVRSRWLTVETNSVRRADDLRAQVEAALRGLVHHRARDHEDVSPTLKKARTAPRAAPPANEAPPPEMLEAVREMKRRHMLSWLDTAVPALSGRTPREASRKPNLREPLKLMLKEIQQLEERSPPWQRVDVGVLWAELNLEP